MWKKFETSARKIVSGHTSSCGCTTESIGVTLIRKELDKRNIKYCTEYKCDDLLSKKNYNLRVDIAILNSEDKPIAFIEYDGEQHYDVNAQFGDKEDKEINFQNIVENDNIKNEYSKEHNIPLYRIRYSRKEDEIISKTESILRELKLIIDFKNLTPKELRKLF